MPEQLKNRIIFIAGPTASGKSAAAMSVAQSIGGEIVNADAMQVYRDLRILTARPTIEDEERIPHHLYGFVDAAERNSAGRWASAAEKKISEIQKRGRPVVLVGGTGLYFRALEEGLSSIPETPPAVRERAAARRVLLGAAAFREEVVSRDQAMAQLPEGDAQRLQRAWEVFEATGRPLSYYQNLPRQPLIDGAAEKIIIVPAREQLYANCDARAVEMLKSGAVDEVRALVDKNLDSSLPAMKALGVPEVACFLRGDAERADTLAVLQQNTRRFAKRQLTWFRNQAPDWPSVEHAQAAAVQLAG